MRHRKKTRKLGRTASHRKATLSALTTSLLRHKRITTTLAKARETRIVAEKLITRARKALAGAGTNGKEGGNGADKFLMAAGHARREVARMIKDRAIISELFSTIAPKLATRPGGYTRIVKLGQRQGDGAELAVIELVDFHTGQETPEKAAPAKKQKAEGKVKPKRKNKAPESEATGEKSAKAKTGEHSAKKA